MSDVQAIDALLASASSNRTLLAPAEERRQLREGLRLSRAHLATALGDGASTVGGWESGRDPSGEVRQKYAYFLDGARTKLDAVAATASGARRTRTAPAPEPEARTSTRSWS
ncbi:helix-turn-helix domain-containing protein [Streptomyces mirabilis]|uniref:helix-turn-helix domain-containing protein n=1 Tax=Streptomyces mirabilis TaxID=68239 RepID=UPI00380EA3A5